VVWGGRVRGGGHVVWGRGVGEQRARGGEGWSADMVGGMMGRGCREVGEGRTRVRHGKCRGVVCGAVRSIAETGGGGGNGVQ